MQPNSQKMNGLKKPIWVDKDNEFNSGIRISDFREGGHMKIEKGAAKNMELVGYHDLEERPGFQMAMQVDDNRWYLYLAHFWHGGWTILDVTEPSDPKFVKFVVGPDFTETIKVQVADGIMITNLQKWIPFAGRPTDKPYEEGIYIWDVKDPVNPKRLGHWKTGVPTGTHRNYYDGGRYVHLAAGAPGFSGNIYRIVDIIDPTHPVEVGRWWLPEQWAAGGAKVNTPAFGLHGPPYPVGDRAYLSYGDAGMVIVDISDITLPKTCGPVGGLSAARLSDCLSYGPPPCPPEIGRPEQ